MLCGLVRAGVFIVYGEANGAAYGYPSRCVNQNEAAAYVRCCGNSDPSYPLDIEHACSGLVTFTQAVAYCATTFVDARLCTREVIVCNFTNVCAMQNKFFHLYTKLVFRWLLLLFCAL